MSKIINEATLPTKEGFVEIEDDAGVRQYEPITPTAEEVDTAEFIVDTSFRLTMLELGV